MLTLKYQGLRSVGGNQPTAIIYYTQKKSDCVGNAPVPISALTPCGRFLTEAPPFLKEKVEIIVTREITTQHIQANSPVRTAFSGDYLIVVDTEGKVVKLLLIQ